MTNSPPYRMPPDRHPEEPGGMCPFLAQASATMALVQVSNTHESDPKTMIELNQMWASASTCPRSRKCEIWNERLNRCGLKQVQV